MPGELPQGTNIISHYHCACAPLTSALNRFQLKVGLFHFVVRPVHEGSDRKPMSKTKKKHDHKLCCNITGSTFVRGRCKLTKFWMC